VYMVNEEKKNQRVVGVDSGMDLMKSAVNLLASSTKLYTYVEQRWKITPSDEQQRLLTVAGSPQNLAEEMSRVYMHKDYCNDISQKAKEELARLAKLREEMMETMRHNEQERSRKVKQASAFEDEKRKEESERMVEMEEEALRLMMSTSDIQLGKNLESVTLTKPAAPAKEAKGKPTKQKTKGMPGPAVDADGQPLLALDDGDKKRKKDKKDKKKKDKKDKKKKKKRGHDSGSDQMGSDQEAAGDAEGTELPVASEAPPHTDADMEEELFGEDPQENTAADAGDGDGGDGLGAADDGDGSDDGKKKKKKDKKDKKDKKGKKDKKDKKRKREEGSGGSDDAKQQKTEGDGDVMEEELFGPDDSE